MKKFFSIGIALFIFQFVYADTNAVWSAYFTLDTRILDTKAHSVGEFYSIIGMTNAVRWSSDNSGDGGTSIQLGGIGLLADGASAGVELGVKGKGYLFFDWKVSSEEGYDLLSFYELGAGITNSISGTGAGWTQVVREIGGDMGTLHTFRWQYEKDPIGDYVGEDSGWVDAIRWVPFYGLTVTGGTGGGFYTNGVAVMVSADAPPTWQRFDRWLGDTNGLSSVTSSNTLYVMASTNAIITATYTYILYPVTVTNGTGGGSYSNATTVIVSANAAPAHFVFDRWIGDTNGVANVTNATTILTVIGGRASVTATYRAILYPVTVTGVTGGSYTNGARVAITALVAPAHYVFDRWTGDTTGLQNLYSASTLLTVTGAATLTATYTPILYPITVTGGQGGGSYAYGSTVTLMANIPEGKRFYNWVGQTNLVADVTAPTTTVYFAGDSLALTSTYCVALTVTHGSGGGWYPEGATAAVVADADPLWMEFTGWTGDVLGQVADASRAETTLVIPTRTSALTAMYTSSVARVAGCYGRMFVKSGVTSGITTDFTAGSPSGTPVVKLGGSGVIPDNGYAALETVVTNGGSILFKWRVSSESTADYLRFKVDGTNVMSISGTKGSWLQVSNRVEGAGTPHTLRWEYVKNGSLASSTDAGWVDDIIWIGDMPVPVIRPDIREMAIDNGAVALRFLGERGITYNVYSNSTLDPFEWSLMGGVPQLLAETNGVFGYETIVTPSAGADRCFYRMVAEGVDNSLYMVIDLSGGAAATSYPVTYLAGEPTGGWTDEYKTTKLVMRKIPAGRFTMGSPPDELGRQDNEVQHTVTLSKDFYMGVFEVTQRQWELVMGNRPSYFNNVTYYMTRPVERVSYYEIRENPNNLDDPTVDWPNNNSVNALSFMGKLRSKTGLETLDLPTESQWEYACRAKTTTALNSGNNLTNTISDAHMAALGRYRANGETYSQTSNPNSGTALCGTFLPNEWGLYDMHGDVWEFCLDWYGPIYPESGMNPVGVFGGVSRILRGGSLTDSAQVCRSAFRLSSAPDYRSINFGFRLVSILP